MLDADITAAKKVFDVNIFGVLEVTQAFSPLLVASKGTIINIGSVVGRVPIPFEGIYNASKAALEQLSKTMRIELAPFDIRVIHVRSSLVIKHECDANSSKVVTGGIKTGFFDHAGEPTFPETSPYYPGREAILPWITGDKQREQLESKLLRNKIVVLWYSQSTAPPEVYAKSVIDNALSRSPSSCQWTGSGAWGTWFISNYLWNNATVHYADTGIGCICIS